MSNEMLDQIKAVPGIAEIYQVTTFKGYRQSGPRDEPEGLPGQGLAPVTIEVWDKGQGSGDVRFSVVATDDEGRRASGNSADRLDVALAIVHWHDLNR